MAAGYGRAQLFTLVLEHAKANAAAGRKSWGYSYAVAGTVAGAIRRSWPSSVTSGGERRRLVSPPDPDLFDRLAATVKVPVSVLQVVRDPFDNIATMWRRGHKSLDRQVDTYFALCATVENVARQVGPGSFHRLRLEDLIADPQARLADVCRFLGVRPEPAYLEACASIVLDAPRRTRDDAPWTPELSQRGRTSRPATRLARPVPQREVRGSRCG